MRILLERHGEPFIDIAEPDKGVEIEFSKSPTGTVLWVNVDGVCRLRVCRIKAPLIVDGIEVSP